MSGHSKWSTIKHQKQANDSARGKLFSRLSKAIAIAITSGGGNNPETNYQLRIAIDQAKTANMPKNNIERVLSKSAEATNLEELTYEGFGPGGVSVIVEVTTDNKNRAVQEVKSAFDKNGGRLAGPGAVSFNFIPKGFIAIKKENDSESQMLSLIDIGVEDIEELSDSFEVYVEPGNINNITKSLQNAGFDIVSTELIQKAKSFQKIDDEKLAGKVTVFLEKLDNLEDVQKVFTNAEFAPADS